MFNKGKILVFFILLMSVGVRAQVDSISSIKSKLKQDTAAVLFNKNTITSQLINELSDSLKPKAFKPDPQKVVWMAAILPGYGQILNKKYWKLPIVYGGFLGMSYLISWNSTYYNSYKTAYLDFYRYTTDVAYKGIVDKNPAAASFIQILPKGRTISDYGGEAAFMALLKTKQDGYRRYRDLSVIALVGYYALTIVDAFVDAQLYDFDISPNLSMHIQPALMQNGNFGIPNALAMQCSISLK